MANIFMRPENMAQHGSRKFYPNEVFKTDIMQECTPGQLSGRCIVLYIDDYIRGRPLEWNNRDKQKDVFVCDSRYSVATNRYDKIKDWKECLHEDMRDEELVLVPFDQPLKLEKVAVVSKDQRRQSAPKKREYAESDESSEEEFADDSDSDEEFDEEKPKRSKRVWFSFSQRYIQLSRVILGKLPVICLTS